jgi:hypothetical protein
MKMAMRTNRSTAWKASAYMIAFMPPVMTYPAVMAVKMNTAVF